MEKWEWPIISAGIIALVIGATVVNDKLTPEAEEVSPRNNPFIKDDSINNPDTDTGSDSDTDSGSDNSIREGDSLLGKGYRDSIGSSDDSYSINNSRGGSRRKHRKNNNGSKGRKASKGNKGRKSRKHNNKKSKSKNSKSF